MFDVRTTHREGAACLVMLGALVACSGEQADAPRGDKAPAKEANAPEKEAPPAQPPRPEGTIRIPGGPFTRGSDEAAREKAKLVCKQTYARPRKCKESWFEAESPARKITLNTFFIDIYEVTNAQYSKCTDAGACTELDYGQCRRFDLAQGERKPDAPLAPRLKDPTPHNFFTFTQ